jgi:hypothetical protein
VASAILGGVSALSGWSVVMIIVAIVAIVLGRQARGRIAGAVASGRPVRGRGLATAGIVLGAIGIVEAVIIFIVAITS